MYVEKIKQRAIAEANYIIANSSTVRETAKVFGVSKSTVHKDISERLSNYSPSLAKKANNVLAKNKAERALRGGIATQRKYLLLKKQS